jgi:hypothetical protein
MRIRRMLGVSSVLALLVTLAVQAPARADVPGAGSWYYFRNMVTGKVLAVNGGQLQNGAKIIQYDEIRKPDTWPIDDQTWYLSTSDGGVTFILTNWNSGRVMAIPNNNTANGTGAIQWDYVPGLYDQQWQVQASNAYPGYYTIRNWNSQRCLGIPNGNTANGVQAIQYTCGNSYRDQFWDVRKFGIAPS